MTPRLTYLGALTLSVLLPLLNAAALGLDASLAAVLPQLQAQLLGAIQLQTSIALKPPSLTGSVAVGAKIVASLAAAVALTPPSVDFAVLAAVKLIAKLKLQIAALDASVSLALKIKGLLLAGGVHTFVYEGPLDQLGATLAGGVAQAGIAPKAITFVPVLVVEASNTTGRAAVAEVFGLG